MVDASSSLVFEQLYSTQNGSAQFKQTAIQEQARIHEKTGMTE